MPERHIVTAARYEGDTLVALMLGTAETSDRSWIVKPKTVSTQHVVDRLLHGDKIFMHFAQDGHVTGVDARLRASSSGGGIETVEVDDPSAPALKVADLPRF